MIMTSLLSFSVVQLEFKARAKTITNIEQKRNKNLNLIVSVQQTKDQLIDFSKTQQV